MAANIYVRYIMKVECKQHNFDGKTVIVSFTSFPARINNVWLTAKTLLNQQGIDNYRVILWLSKEEFPQGVDTLPRNLKKLISKGLDIRMVEENLRPHTKYIYAFEKFSCNNVVTVDDDILYPSTFLKSLVDVGRKFPNCVIYHRGREIVRDSYSNWLPIKESLQPSSRNFPTGVGGVMYPPQCYDEGIFNRDAIKSTCLNADDLWLSVMCRLKGTKTVYTGCRYGYIAILSSQKHALMKSNCDEGRNDVQIGQISEWLDKHFGVDFYVNIKNRE